MAISLSVSATVQTETQVTTTATSCAGLKPSKRTFSLSGVLGTAIQKGDSVELWGSNDGGTTFQPLRQNGAPVQMSYYNPEVVIDDCSDHYGTRRVSIGAGSTLSAVGLNGEAASNPLVQGGSGTLVAGTATISGVILTASSAIVVTMKDPGTGAITSAAGFDVPAASRNVAAGTFVVNMLDDTKAVLNTAVSTFNYIIVG